MGLTHLSNNAKQEDTTSPLIFCPCCQQLNEGYTVYFSNNLEALRCSKCGIAFPK